MSGIDNNRKVPTRLLAIIAGTAVANLYYLQPLLRVVSVAFHLHGGEAGFLVSAGQAGFVAGLATLLPLGDRFDRRKLIALSLVLAAGFDLWVAVARGLPQLLLALAGLGAFAVVAQVAVTYAAAAAPVQSRSRAVATVMSGLLAGIVLARTYSGAVAGVASYRIVFVIAASAGVVLALATLWWLPAEKEKPRLKLGDILRTSLELYRREPLLRFRSLLGMLGFASFSMFWTTMALALSRPPYYLSTGVIGLFGFAGLAGVLAARLVGKLSDQGRTGFTTLMSFSIVALSWLGFLLDRRSLLLFAVLTATLDAGLQGAQLTNQSLIYRLGRGSHGRVTMVYMVNYFFGGLVGSLSASLLFTAGGFFLVSLAGIVAGLLSLGIWLGFAGRERRWISEAGTVG